MALADSNVWLALTLNGHEFHRAASLWMAGVKARRPVLFCRSTQQSFLRLLTTAAIMRTFGNPPLTNHQAWDLYRNIIADPRVRFAAEPPGLERHWEHLAGGDAASPKLWMDAYLAAFAIAGAHQLATFDQAFQQFEGLDLVLLGKQST